MKWQFSHYKLLLLLIGLVGLLLVSTKQHKNEQQIHAIRTAYAADLIAIDSATVRLQRAIETRQPVRTIQGQFRRVRLAYKRSEWLTEAYYPVSARQLNGPPVPEGEIDDGIGRQIDAQGFQVLEEMLFPYDSSRRTDALRQLAKIRQTLLTLWRVGTSIQLTDARVFEAMRLAVFRIVTLNLSGFDSAIDQQGLPESAESLRALRRVVALYPLASANPALVTHIDQLLSGAETALQERSFDDFDRLGFIRTYANPLSSALFDAQAALNLPVSTGKQFLSGKARTLNDTGIFNPYFFAPFDALPPTPERIAVGKMLFASTLLTANEEQSEGKQSTERRSCASCHQPDRAFTDGLTTPLRLGSTHERIRRNTPSLFNAGLQQFQFLDARTFFIEDQINDVLTNPHEMGGSWPQALRAISSDSPMVRAFERAYPGSVISKPTVTNALAQYIRSLVSVDSRFDRYMRNEAVQLTKEEKRGFNLFMGKAKCGTCHYYPLFNGTVPPAYIKTESEVIGAPAAADEWMVSADSGRYHASRLKIHLRAFKIPGIRHVAQTAPYMHNGVYQTLEQVVEFYNKGGGNGLGFALDNQTLPAEPLHLTKADKRALVAFMKAL